MKQGHPEIDFENKNLWKSNHKKPQISVKQIMQSILKQQFSPRPHVPAAGRGASPAGGGGLPTRSGATLRERYGVSSEDSVS